MSHLTILLEHEMLVASYDFDATIPQTLSFKKDDNFIFHSTNNIKKNWWSIIDAHGKVGYIPSNYVSIVKVILQLDPSILSFRFICLKMYLNFTKNVYLVLP